MSTLTKVLERNVAEVEKRADLTEGRYRLEIGRASCRERV